MAMTAIETPCVPTPKVPSLVNVSMDILDPEKNAQVRKGKFSGGPYFCELSWTIKFCFTERRLNKPFNNVVVLSKVTAEAYNPVKIVC